MKISTTLKFALILMLFTKSAHAQGVTPLLIDAAPAAINPAFTAMSKGNLRLSGLYERRWSSYAVPYVSFGASGDMSAVQLRNGDYIGAGLQLFNDGAGDGNLQNFSGLVSLAYHKTFNQNKDKYHNSDLSFGLQGGYISKDFDRDFSNHLHLSPSGTQPLGLNNPVTYYPVNAGVSFTQSRGLRFNYTIGLSAHNLNQPTDAPSKRQHSMVGLDMRYSGVFTANWVLTDRLSIRPAVFYELLGNGNNLFVGNEFMYKISRNISQSIPTSVFAGTWYDVQDEFMFTAGVEVRRFRLGLVYSFDNSSLASEGTGGVGLSLKYAVPR